MSATPKAATLVPRLIGLEPPSQRLADIPGIGPRLEAKLLEFFGDTAAALQAIRTCRVSLIAEAVGAATAHRIIHGCYRLVHGRWPRDAAGTGDAWRLYLVARSHLAHYLYTRAGQDLAECLLPLPPTAQPTIQARLNLTGIGRRILDILGSRDVLRSAAGLEWPRPLRPKSLGRTLVVVGDEDAARRAREKLGGLVRVVYVDDATSVDEAVEGESDVVVYDPYGVYHGIWPRVEEISIPSIAPEYAIEWFRANKGVVERVHRLVETLGAERLAELLNTLGYNIDARLIARVTETARLVMGSDIDPSVDEEYARLRRALALLDTVVDEAEDWANNTINERLSSRELRVPGDWVLEILRSLREGGPVPSLPEEIHSVFEEVAGEAERRIAEKLGLEPDEEELIRGIFPREPIVPVTPDRARLEELRLLLLQKLHVRRLRILQGIAEQLYGREWILDALVEALALADLATAYTAMASKGFTTPVLNNQLGIGVMEGLEFSLLDQQARGVPVQRVSYVVGSSPLQPSGTKGERIILLTGANSGGKTTLLRMLGEYAFAAASGLPVPAKKAYVSVFDQVYFISKPQGMADAGALEQTLKLLAEIAVTGRGSRLVLVDELEAATEADAAAKILASLVETLAETENTVAVIVTHLAPEILENISGEARGHVRVDGIEAQGLDENYNLIVDRNPKYNHLARSTPELVVTKLLHTAPKEHRDFYQRILDKLARKRGR